MYRFVENLKSDKTFFFYRGGTALYASLSAVGIEPGDEIILPVFTCPAVPSACVRLAAKPVYVDVDPATFNLDPNKIEVKITNRTKAIIAQHTFGIPAGIDSILDIARRHNLWVIEDACHALGSKYKGQEVGTFGDVTFYSFGWYKPVVLGVGGAAVVNTPQLKPRMEQVYRHFVRPSLEETLVLYLQYAAYSWLVSPASFWLLKEVYRLLSIAGIIAGTSRRKEKANVKYPRQEAKSTRSQVTGKRIIPYQKGRLFNKLDRWSEVVAHQEWLVSQYRQRLYQVGYTPFELDGQLMPVYYKYPVLSDRKNEIFQQARQLRVEMSDMFGSPLYPPDRRANWKALGYEEGMCPISESISDRIVALPIHTRVKDKNIEKTVALLASFD